MIYFKASNAKQATYQFAQASVGSKATKATTRRKMSSLLKHLVFYIPTKLVIYQIGYQELVQPS
jgi:hypothetical protein